MEQYTARDKYSLLLISAITNCRLDRDNEDVSVIQFKPCQLAETEEMYCIFVLYKR